MSSLGRGYGPTKRAAVVERQPLLQFRSFKLVCHSSLRPQLWKRIRSELHSRFLRCPLLIVLVENLGQRSGRRVVINSS
jgi:hypothetical protein